MAAICPAAHQPTMIVRRPKVRCYRTTTRNKRFNYFLTYSVAVQRLQVFGANHINLLTWTIVRDFLWVVPTL
jgi:hypothetical protein